MIRVTITAALAFAFASTVAMGCVARKYNAGRGDASAKSDPTSGALAKTLGAFGPQDVAVLFPLPSGWHDDVRLLGLGWEGNGSQPGYWLLHKSQFDQVLREGYGGFKDQGSTDDYKRLDVVFDIVNRFDRWKVVGIRYAPCVRANPKAPGTPCHDELRLVAQPLFEKKETNTNGTTPSPGDFNVGTRLGANADAKRSQSLKGFEPYDPLWTEDQALHLVYKLDAKDNAKVVRAFAGLKEATEAARLPDGRPLSQLWTSDDAPGARVWVHPLMHASISGRDVSPETKEALRAPEDAFKKAVLETARATPGSPHGAANLDHVLFMGTGVRHSGSGWAFSAFYPDKPKEDGTGHSFRRARLNQAPSDALRARKPELGNARDTQIVIHENHNGFRYNSVPFEKPYRRDSLIGLLETPKLTPEQHEEFWARAGRVLNPSEHSQHSTDCVSCHTATSVSALRSYRNPWAVPLCLANGYVEGKPGLSCEATLAPFQDKLTAPVLKSPASALTDLPAEVRKALTAVEAKHDTLESWVGFGATAQYPIFVAFNLRQFGYYTRYPAVSIRTQAEASRDAKFVRDNARTLAGEGN